jgi:hypothetical protein
MSAATQLATQAPHAVSQVPQSWRTDIEALVPGMDRLHPRLDHGVSLDQLTAAAADLAAAAATLTDSELLAGVMRIVAMVSSKGCDAHTGAYVWGSGNYPVDSLPLRLWLFGDDVYVVDALDPYRDLIGRKIASLAGVPIADAIALVDPLVPRDNEQTVRLLTPRFLLIPQVLAGVGLSVGPTVALETVDGDGAQSTASVTTIAMADYNDWAGPYGLHLPADSDVLYLSNMDEPLWWQNLGDGTLFVQYNQTRFVSFLLDDLHDAITAAGVKRVVIDLRHNTGGEVRAVTDVVEAMTDPDVAAVGAPYVITSRNTFSAAGLLVAKLQAGAGAKIVGEPMGACPTAWGNAREFKLPFTGIAVDVATLLEVGVSEDDARLTIEPDISVPLTELDWAAHRDPALEAIQAVP